MNVHKSILKIGGGFIVATVLLVCASLEAIDVMGDYLELLSKSSNGKGGNWTSLEADLDSSGNLAVFMSAADNLVDRDNNGVNDIFLHNAKTEQTTRISTDSLGNELDDASFNPTISGNGAVAAFEVYDDSFGSNTEIFTKDLNTGKLEKISVSYLGSSPDAPSWKPATGNAGNIIAYQSWASNIVQNDNNGTVDIFAYDRRTQTNVRVSVDSSGNEGDGWSYPPEVSPDERFVVFSSDATNLSSSGISGVFLHDLASGTTRHVSPTTDGKNPTKYISASDVSAFGSLVVFSSQAKNLVLGDTNGVSDVFLHNVNTGETRILSRSATGQLGNGSSYSPTITADGRYVAFSSSATNLVANDTNGQSDIFVVRVADSAIAMVNVTMLTGSQGDLSSFAPQIAPKGDWIAFGSYADNFSSIDADSTYDIFRALNLLK